MRKKILILEFSHSDISTATSIVLVGRSKIACSKKQLACHKQDIFWQEYTWQSVFCQGCILRMIIFYILTNGKHLLCDLSNSNIDALTNIMPTLSLERKFKLVFVREYTKTSKSIQRPAFKQSNCKTASSPFMLIECHIIEKNNVNSIILHI